MNMLYWSSVCVFSYETFIFEFPIKAIKKTSIYIFWKWVTVSKWSRLNVTFYSIQGQMMNTSHGKFRDSAPVPFEYKPLAQGSHLEEFVTKKPRLHGGHVFFSPDAGRSTAASRVSLQILGSIHLYMSWVCGTTRQMWKHDGGYHCFVTA